MEKLFEKQFIEALKAGKSDKAIFLTQFMDVNSLFRGESLLIWAKKMENEKVVAYLEEKGAEEKVIAKSDAIKLGEELVESIRNGNLEISLSEDSFNENSL